MATSFPPGAYKQVQITENEVAPWYVVPFDKQGSCTAPLTRKHLVDAVARDKYSDVFLFSHGWNNDWDTASERYEDFIGGFAAMRRDFDLPVGTGYRPLLAGIFWPSTALVMPWERAPKFAGAPPTTADDAENWRRELEDIATQLDRPEREDFYRLAQSENLSEAEAERLAELVAKVGERFSDASQDAGGASATMSAQDVLANARHIPGPTQPRRKPGQFGFASATTAGPQAAFELSDLDPRKLIRIATVLQMKDRAARVGASGVGPLLRDIVVAQPQTRVHLIGHSYGCIVMLSATAVGDLPGQVQSILLLQPAVSQWCFAANVADRGFAGGYRRVLDRVRGRIFTTYSNQDVPLTKLFHLAARRDQDLGQPQIAGGLPKPPSIYAALGGYGPQGLGDAELQLQDMAGPPNRYANTERKVWALNGNKLIAGHGDISVPATWWALFQQI